MGDASPKPTSEPVSSVTRGEVPPTPSRCFTGALISGGLAVVLYFLTQSIVQVFAGIPLPTKSRIAVNISIAVRTLVIGGSTLATAIFAIATLGLVALGIQLLWKQSRSN